MSKQERDKVLLRMLKTKPKHHNGDDALSAEMLAGTTDVKRLAKLAGQPVQPARTGKKRPK